MVVRIAIFLLILFTGCQLGSTEKSFKPTKFTEDVKTLTLEQVSTSPDRKHFLGIFYDESRSMSGIKIVKLYGADSISASEAYFGAHPLEVEKWSDSTIVFNAGVFSAHGDAAIRKRYLDGSVDRNTTLGNYKLSYLKDYDFRTK
jgi:hypothetical protein